MSDLIARVRAAQVAAAEDAVIASIPAELLESIRRADEAFKKRGGCTGCGSQVLAVHYGSCPTLADDLY